MASHFRGGRSVGSWLGFHGGLQQQEVSRQAPCFLRSVLIKHSGDNQTKDRSRAVLPVKEKHIYGPLGGGTPRFMVPWNLSAYKDNRCIQKQ